MLRTIGNRISICRLHSFGSNMSHYFTVTIVNIIYLLLLISLFSSLKIYISPWSHLCLLTKAVSQNLTVPFYIIWPMTIPWYIPSIIRIFSSGHIFVNHSRYSRFQYVCFHQDFLITLQLLFQSPLHFV